MKNRGLLIAGALALAALYIFAEEEEPFTEVFNIETLPRVLRDKIELRWDGVLVTISNISKNSDFMPHGLTSKEFGAIILNKMRDEFGLREHMGDDGDGQS